jgi:prolycopene isomerase
VPADFASYRAALDREFPDEREALDAFFEEVDRAYLLGLLAYFRGRVTEGLERLRPLTVRQVLDRTFRSEKLKLLLTADCPHWGSPPSRTSFVFDSMLRLSYFLGNYYPVGGSQAFADELALRFEERGGHILMSTRADRIEIADGAVRGVELETLRGPLAGRRRVATGAVVSNADLLQTAERLVGADHLDPERLGEIRRLRPTFPCFLTHVGLEGVPPEVLEEAQGYYWRHWNPDRVGRDGLVCKIFAPTLYEPRMAPAGGQEVILQKVLEMDYEGVADWDAHKAAVEAEVMGHLERVIPGVGEHVVVHLSASARTARRFTLNSAGAMLGWEMSPDQLGAGRPDQDLGVAGLVLAGHWTRPGGGITPVIISALRAAEAVLAGSRDGSRSGPEAGSEAGERMSIPRVHSFSEVTSHGC